MSDQGGRRGPRRPPQNRGGPGPRRGPGPGGPPTGGRPSEARIGLRPLGGGDFELVHPRCIEERRDDYEEGLEALRAGEPEEAVEMLRYALNGCPDNLWIHTALGRIALKEAKDPSLARGHFGYALELVLRILPPDFTGRLPRGCPPNAPLYDALEGLIACVDMLKLPAESRELRGLLARFGGEPRAPTNA